MIKALKVLVKFFVLGVTGIIERIPAYHSWVDAKSELPPANELVLIRVRNKNKPDGIYLYDVCFVDDSNEWSDRYHTWEDIVEWKFIK